MLRVRVVHQKNSRYSRLQLQRNRRQLIELTQVLKVSWFSEATCTVSHTTFALMEFALTVV